MSGQRTAARKAWFETNQKLNLFLTLALVFIGSASLFVSLAEAQTDSSLPRLRRAIAQQAPATKKVQTGVYGVIKTDGAMIYRTPDFDGDVLGSLPLGARVVMSRTTYGAMAKFFKVRVKVGGQSLLGYVADIDVAAGGAAKSAATTAPSGKVAKKDSNGKPEKKKKKHSLKLHDDHQPIFFTHFLGLVAGVSDFKEKISGVGAEQNLLVYGLKVTGPDLLIKGPIMELNVLLHYGAPSYYGALSNGPPTGFVLWTDTLLLLPFVQKQNYMVFGGFGPMLILSDFHVTNSGQASDLLALNLGAVLDLGTGVRVGQVALRLEARMNWEVRTYTSYLASVQIPY